ncbi:MAG: phage/plasmid primase, P4 family [Actinoallomurus sp.]
MTALHDAALAFHDAGCSVVPARTDGSKAPAGFWKKHQAERPGREQVEAWFAGEDYDGFGIITGAVSGGVEMLEFEGRAIAEGYLQRFTAALGEHGMQELGERIAGGYGERTPSGGLHLLVRTDGEPRPNTKLACRPAREDELTDDEKAIRARKPGKVFARTLIETRGEGGFVVVAPSTGRTHETGKAWAKVAGSPATIAVITEDERDALFAIASLLDEMPVTAPPPPPTPGMAFSGNHDDVLRPGDDYNERADWADILTPHGWTHVINYGQARGWRRPGKNRGVSATTGHSDTGDRLFVFTSSTEFDTETPYSKFAAYALLEHGGSYADAASTLRAQGYGGEIPHDDEDLEDLIAPPSAGSYGSVDGNLATVHQLRPDDEPHETPKPQAEVKAHPLKYTDDWLAAILVAQFGDQIRYCPKFGYWLAWDGARWTECTDTGPVRQYVRTIARSMPEDTKPGLEAKKRAASRTGIDAAIALAQGDPRVVVRPDQLDAHPWELNTPGGIIDLKTGTLTPHDPLKLHTRITAATPDLDADTAVWDRFLHTTFDGHTELIAFMQRLAGYSAIGVVREHIFPFAYGEGGNGKGAYLEAVTKVLGDYAGKTKRGFLAARDRDAHPEEIAVLAGLRMVVCAETNETDRFDEGKVKELTGGDTLTGRHLYGKSFSFEPQMTLWLMGNHRPKVESGGRSFWRRMREIPFEHKVPASEEIPDFQGVLAREHGGALMAWIVRGAVAYAKQGLAAPDIVMRATKEYEQEQDTVKGFVEECCHIGGAPVVQVLAEKLRTAYERWCKAEGITPLDSRALGRRLKADYRIERKRSNGKSFYTNVALLASDDDDERDGWR